MIKYIKEGSIFAVSGVKCYAHGCNCAGAMGKGIALQFKRQYPEMYKQYRARCLAGTFNLGDVFEYVTVDERVYNLGTQKDWRTKADLNAIKISIHKMLESASQSKVKSIAIPKIGAGLGGLSWEVVKNCMENIAANFPDIDLIVVENYKADN